MELEAGYDTDDTFSQYMDVVENYNNDGYETDECLSQHLHIIKDNTCKGKLICYHTLKHRHYINILSKNYQEPVISCNHQRQIIQKCTFG